MVCALTLAARGRNDRRRQQGDPVAPEASYACTECPFLGGLGCNSLSGRRMGTELICVTTAEFKAEEFKADAHFPSLKS